MRRLLHVWLVVIPCLGLSTAFLFSLIIVICVLGYDVQARRLLFLWCRLNVLVSGVTIRTKGLERTDPRQSYIIVANHQSLYDIYAIQGYTGMDVLWVMKKELRRIPLFGFACEKMHQIIIDRNDIGAALESINAAKDRLGQGVSVAFFPEGTRSRDGRLLPFKKGAFRMAIDTQLPLLPISIHGSREVLPSDTMKLSPGTITMVLHDPIPTTGLTSAETQPLLERARLVLSQPSGDPEPAAAKSPA